MTPWRFDNWRCGPGDSDSVDGLGVVKGENGGSKQTWRVLLKILNPGRHRIPSSESQSACFAGLKRC